MKSVIKHTPKQKAKTLSGKGWKSQSKDAASALALVIFLSACQSVVQKPVTSDSTAEIKAGTESSQQLELVLKENPEQQATDIDASDSNNATPEVEDVMIEQQITAKMVLSSGKTNALLSGTHEQEIKNFIGSLSGWHSIDKVKVVGHTDSVGSTASNERLSIERAKAVVSQLTALGLDKQLYQVVGKGESEPAVDNATIPGRAKNRRVEVFVEGIELKKATEVAVKAP